MKALDDAGLAPLVEVARAETLLERRLLSSHAVAGRAAVRVGMAAVGSPTKTSVAAALRRAGSAHTAALRRSVRPLLFRHVPKVFSLVRRLAVAEIEGRFRGALDYDAARVLASKAEDDDLASTPRDEDDTEKLILLFLLWSRSFWDRRLLPRIRERVDVEVFGEGVDALRRRDAFGAILREETGIEPFGDPPRSPVGRTNARTVAVAVTTTTRAVATLSAMSAAGIGHWVWVTAGDERVCSRCSAMDGRTFPVKETRDLYGRLLRARSVEEQKRIAPWLSERQLLPLVHAADASHDPSAVLLEHGVTLPLHSACRCSLDFVPGSP